jgi:putative holliday junction resolvase
VKVLALDYGRARTGVAVSDPTGSIARPLSVVPHAATEEGIARIVELSRREEVGLILVGLPLTLRGERGEQAAETEQFLELLRAATDLPVETFDERFTTKLAAASPREAEEDSVAAAHLLTTYLAWKSAAPR